MNCLYHDMGNFLWCKFLPEIFCRINRQWICCGVKILHCISPALSCVPLCILLPSLTLSRPPCWRKQWLVIVHGKAVDWVRGGPVPPHFWTEILRLLTFWVPACSHSLIESCSNFQTLFLLTCGSLRSFIVGANSGRNLFAISSWKFLPMPLGST